MSRYFVLPYEPVGPGGDIFFRRPSKDWPEGWYLLYVGEAKLGQVMKGTRGHWIGLSFNDYSEFFGVRQMEGFATRWDASTFIIKHHGYWMQNERRMKADHERHKKEFGFSV